jgi:DNA-binding transcriptional LysR family regulator
MNWEALRYDWSQMRAFLATAEEGSLSAAARALGLTQPTLGRQVTALEQALGVTLFERVGRSLRLTQAGRDLVGPAAEMRDAALRFSLLAEGQNQDVAGRVSITATEFVAASVLPEAIAELRARAPGLAVEIIASNAVQDLTLREADISIRHARPAQEQLIARKLGERSAYLYAASAYLDRIGRPQSPGDLAGADFVGFEEPETVVPVLARVGVPIRKDNIRTFSNSGRVILELLRAGLGVSVLTEDMAADAPELERVLETVVRVPVPVWLATHRELHTARRIRLVFDHLAEHIRRTGVVA